MNDSLPGRYFLPGSARFVPARAEFRQGGLRISDPSDAVLAEAPLAQMQISARLGNMPRRFSLTDGACFETDDNDAADALLKQSGRARVGAIHRIEQSWRWVAASVLLAGAVAYVFVVFGIPAIALWLARETPQSVNPVIAAQELAVLDRALLAPTKLSAADQAKAQMLFAEVAARGQRAATGYRLLFRSAPGLGPNALALPDGTVVMTDALWPLVKADDEIQGVFAHEIAHVDRAHTLQSLDQAALVPAAIAIVTGDLSQISQVATVLPGVLLQAAYSRNLEQQADDDAAVTVKGLGGDPGHLADLLQRMEARICRGSSCPPSWLGTHPETSARAQRLRAGAPTSSTR